MVARCPTAPSNKKSAAKKLNDPHRFTTVGLRDRTRPSETIELSGNLELIMKSQYREDGDTAPTSAFLTDDPLEILRYACDSFISGVPVALATLVEIRGGAARSLGAQMTVRLDGLYCGFVSGGCTEASVAAEAIEALRVGHDRYLSLGEGSRFFDIVLPCGGGIRLAIHVLRDVRAIQQVLATVGIRRAGSLLYRPQAEDITFNPTSRLGWEEDGFSILYRPSTNIFLFGGKLEAEATRRVAESAGYKVKLIDQTNARGIPELEIDEFSSVAMLFHDIDHELPILEKALESRAFYIGALGSSRTNAKRSEALRHRGYTDTEIARIKAPIGIFDKARDAPSIALSVVADIASVAARIRTSLVS